MNIVHWNVPTKVVDLLEKWSDELVLTHDLFSSGDYSDQVLNVISSDKYKKWKEDEEYLPVLATQPTLLIGEVEQIDDIPIVGFLTTDILGLKEPDLGVIIDSYLQRAKYFYLEKEIDVISLDIDRMREQVFSELTLSKKIYQRVVPVREDKLSSCKIASKFESGIKGGGEFFDWRELGGKVFLYLFSTSSYSLTASLSRYFVSFLENGKFNTSRLEHFEKTIQGVIADFKLKKDVSADYLFLVLDSTSLQLEGRSSGNHSIYTSEGDFLSATIGTLINSHLSRGEVLVIQSSGFVESQNDLLGKKFQIEDISGMKEENSRDFFDTKFKQLIDKTSDDFLPYDSTLIKIEVIKNGMFKV